MLKHNIAVGRFDPDQVRSLMDMNRGFIRDQEGPELKITSPAAGFTTSDEEIVVRGTQRNVGGVCIFLRRSQQARFIRNSRTELSEDLWMMVALYFDVAKQLKTWMGRIMPNHPPGMHVYDQIDVERR